MCNVWKCSIWCAVFFFFKKKTKNQKQQKPTAQKTEENWQGRGGWRSEFLHGVVLKSASSLEIMAFKGRCALDPQLSDSCASCMTCIFSTLAMSQHLRRILFYWKQSGSHNTATSKIPCLLLSASWFKRATWSRELTQTMCTQPSAAVVQLFLHARSAVFRHPGCGGNSVPLRSGWCGCLRFTQLHFRRYCSDLLWSSDPKGMSDISDLLKIQFKIWSNTCLLF